MAAAHFVKKARKNYREHGIKKGESYYWWKFRHGSKQYSKTQPKPSQLTQSEFYSTLYDIQERVSTLTADGDSLGEIESIADDLSNLASQCEDNRSNMPESLQDSETGQLLEERAERCQQAADELSGIDLTFEASGDIAEDDEEGLAEEEQEFWDEVLAEAQGVDLEIE